MYLKRTYCKLVSKSARHSRNWEWSFLLKLKHSFTDNIIYLNIVAGAEKDFKAQRLAFVIASCL